MRFLTDRIAVGGLDAFHDIAELKRQGITAVLNVAAKTQPDVRGTGLMYACMPLHDNHENARHLMVAAAAALAGLLQTDGKVLVCCQSGLSRSPAVVAITMDWTPEHLRRKDPLARVSAEMERWLDI